MKDSECIAFLQWALPSMQLRWPGYRKVRRQVCKRIDRRIASLGLEGVDAYRARLAADPSEWAVLDSFTRISISRFHRDRDVFDYLREQVLPELQVSAAPGAVQIWSAGCAAGEEPYSLAIAAREQRIAVRIVATDLDENQLRRAREARYPPGCLKDLPLRYRATAFERQGEDFVLREELRADVELLQQDLRKDMPPGPFDLVLCRYLAFTYFEAPLQRKIAEGLLARTRPNGFLVLGKRERWPEEVPGVLEERAGLRVYRKAVRGSSVDGRWPGR